MLGASMDPLAEIQRLRHLAAMSMWVSGVVTVAYFGTLIYLAVKASKNRALLRRYPRAHWMTEMDELVAEPGSRDQGRH